MTQACDRIAFFGTPEFAASSLQALLDNGENVVAVFTQPDRPRGRNRKLAAPPVKVLAQSRNIPVFQPEKVRTEAFRSEVEALQLDLAVVAAYGRIIPGTILDLPTYGFVNVHASLLPAYRGASPIQRAVANGDLESGITIMQMDEGLDTGDILHQLACPIGPKTTASDLHDELAVIGGEALTQYLCTLRHGTVHPVTQDDERATYAPLLAKEDGRVDWSSSAKEIYNQIRGFFPWPGAYTFVMGKRLRIYPLEGFAETLDQSFPPGTVIRAGGNVLDVACGEGAVRCGALQLEGRRAMEVEDFLKGFPLEVGTVLDGEETA